MGEKTQNRQSFLLSNGILALGTVVLLLFIYFQKWTDFWVMFFLWIPLSVGIWFLILGKIKPQMQLQDMPVIFNPIGNERESGRLFLIFTLVNETILLILGWDSVARYQLMDNYGFLYLIPFITIYNLVWIVWIFTVWQNTNLILKLPEDRVKNLHRLDLIAIRTNAKRVMNLFLILEILVVIDFILANTVHWNIWMVNLRTPGYEIDLQGQIPLSGLVWILLGVQPIVSLVLMKFTFRKAHAFDLALIFPEIEKISYDKQDLRKILRTIALFKEAGSVNLKP